MRIRPAVPVVLVAIVAGTALTFAQQSGEAIPVPLTDPARPATVQIDMLNGAMTIRGENRKDVLVTARGNDNDNDDNRGRRGRGRVSPNDPSLEGFTRLNQRGGFEITAANNVVSIDTGIRSGGELEVRVPMRTNLKLEGTNGAGITVENVEGDIEAEHTNGSIRLTNVAGSVVAETTNGSVVVVLTRIAGEKAMSFITLNGNVDVTLPATAKANLRMRSDNGDIYTQFEVTERPAPPPPASQRNGRLSIEVNKAILGTINGGGPEFHLQTLNGNIFLRRGK
jgi:hypothetical protein